MRFRETLISTMLFILVLAFGTAGFMLITHSSFLDALYMTVITISTVGFGEVVSLGTGGRLFTILLIFVGVGFVLYLFSRITESIVEGGLRATLGRLKMKKKVAKLSDHYIVCGFGRIGQVICKILKDNRKPFVVIEKKGRLIEEIIDLGYMVLEGEASDDETLVAAGIERARGLVSVVSTDADTVYITLTARGIRPDLFIIARSSGAEGAEKKLLRAGANRVFSPYEIGATRMAQEVVRPTVVDFVDLAIQGGELGLRLEELAVSEGAACVGKTLVESGIRREHNLIVVAIKPRKGEMIFNPTPSTIINAGDILVVLGDVVDIEALAGEFRNVGG